MIRSVVFKNILKSTRTLISNIVENIEQHLEKVNIILSGIRQEHVWTSMKNRLPADHSFGKHQDTPFTQNSM